MQLGTKDRAATAQDTITRNAGICAGTTIMTLDGEMPVEHLNEGDRVITRDSGMAVLRRIVARRVKLRPVRIKAGSLGHTRPDRDMIVTPDAELHIRDWRAEALFGQPAALVAAHRLLDGEFLREAAQPVEMMVYDLHFDRQHILYADGVELASA